MAARKLKLMGSLALLAVSPACAADAPTQPDFAALEKESGGRLGVVLVQPGHRPTLAWRQGERFAMCSTFKLSLAGMVLEGARQGKWRMDEVVPAERAVRLDYAPVVQQRLAQRIPLTLGDAAEAAVEVSDNMAANLVLDRTGGPPALTRYLRSIGDPVTRLDRTEPTLNENAVGDPRDTTSPTAMSTTIARLVLAPRTDPVTRETLRRWTSASTTGLVRVRGGLPKEWPAGDKTGTCGNAYNDIGWFIAPGGRQFTFAVYLDRPKLDTAASNALIARIGAEFARVVAAR